MQIVADLHTHTSVSHHAYSSLEEMVRGAKRAGLSAIAITDHGPALEDGAHRWHFSNLDIVPRMIDGVMVLRGIELNILPPNGCVDPLEEYILESLDYLLASFHAPCFPPSTPARHTEALEGILRNPYITTLGHMGNPEFSFDFEHIISQCNQYGKIVEVNNGSIRIRKGSKENCAKIVNLCKQYEVPIAVSTDAHISYSVGRFDNALALLDELEFPEELVINSSMDRLKAYFRQTKGLDLDTFREGEV